MNTYVIKVKGDFETFELLVISTNLDYMLQSLLDRPAVKTVKIRKLSE